MAKKKDEEKNRTNEEVNTSEEKKEGEARVRVKPEDVLMTIEDFITSQEHPERRGSAVGAGFKAWWTQIMNRSLGTRQKKADWIKDYQKCLKTPTRKQ